MHLPSTITDQEPINNFEFLRPLVEGLGAAYPTRSIPLPAMVLLAYVSELMHVLLRSTGLPAPDPFLTLTEVYKCGVTHHFDPEPARQQLGYVPLVPGPTARRRLVRAWRRKIADEQRAGAQAQAWPRGHIHARLAHVLVRTLALLAMATRMLLLLVRL